MDKATLYELVFDEAWRMRFKRLPGKSKPEGIAAFKSFFDGPMGVGELVTEGANILYPLLPPIKPIPKTIDKWVSAACAGKWDVRQTLHQPWLDVDNERVVATNGHIINIVDVFDTGEKFTKSGNLSFDLKAYHDVDLGKYSQYERLIPSNIKYKTLDVDDITFKEGSKKDQPAFAMMPNGSAFNSLYVEMALGDSKTFNFSQDKATGGAAVFKPLNSGGPLDRYSRFSLIMPVRI